MTGSTRLSVQRVFVRWFPHAATAAQRGEAPPWSVLMASAATRAGVASVVVLILWLAVVWALADPTS